MTTPREPPPDFRDFVERLDGLMRGRPSGFEVVTLVVVGGGEPSMLSTVHPAIAVALLARAAEIAARALGGKDGCG
jgi:hypothetical protein